MRALITLGLTGLLLCWNVGTSLGAPAQRSCWYGAIQQFLTCPTNRSAVGGQVVHDDDDSDRGKSTNQDPSGKGGSGSGGSGKGGTGSGGSGSGGSGSGGSGSGGSGSGGSGSGGSGSGGSGSGGSGNHGEGGASGHTDNNGDGKGNHQHK